MDGWSFPVWKRKPGLVAALRPVFRGSLLHFENLWGLEGESHGNCLPLPNKEGEERVLLKVASQQRRPWELGQKHSLSKARVHIIGPGTHGLGLGSLALHLVQGEQGLHTWFVCLCEISFSVLSDSLTSHLEDCLLNKWTGGVKELTVLLVERWGWVVMGWEWDRGGGGYCWLKLSWSISMPKPSCLQEGLMQETDAGGCQGG